MACPVKLMLLCLMNSLLTLCGSVSANKTLPYFVEVEPHAPEPYHVDEEEEKMVMFTMRQNQEQTYYKVLPVSSDPEIMETTGNMSYGIDPGAGNNISMTIKGRFLGRAFLKLFINTTFVDDVKMYEISQKIENDFDWYELPQKYQVTVSRKESALSHAFTGMVIVLVCLANIAMGCKTELHVVKEVLRKPVGPLTGMFSQFILMPLISLAVIYSLKFDPVNALGFFAMACSPGGAASNMYTYLLAGDVSLSVTMTLCSTLLSFGMVPLWLFTVGTKVIYRVSVKIPYTNILTSLAGLIIPVIIGMVIQWKKPNWAKYITKGIRPLMIIFFILVFSLGVYANLYIFTLMRNKPEILLAGALVPYIGFIFGGIVALITRQSWPRIRTIAIETGIQNTGIAIVLLKVSLAPPDNDISIVAPIAAAIFTPIPMLVAIAYYEIRTRCFGKKKEEFYLDDHEGVGSGSDSEKDTVKGEGEKKTKNNGETYTEISEEKKRQ